MPKIANLEILCGLIVSVLIYCLHKRDNGLFRLVTKCACVSANNFVPVCASTYPMEHNLTSIMTLNLELYVSKQAQLSNMPHHTKTYLNAPHRGNN